MIEKLHFCSTAGGMSANIATFENYIKQSEESQGTVVTVLRQGYLHKRSSNMRREWKRRFFVLDSLGVLYYYSNKVCCQAVVFWSLNHPVSISCRLAVLSLLVRQDIAIFSKSFNVSACCNSPRSRDQSVA